MYYLIRLISGTLVLCQKKENMPMEFVKVLTVGDHTWIIKESEKWYDLFPWVPSEVEEFATFKSKNMEDIIAYAAMESI